VQEREGNQFRSFVIPTEQRHACKAVNLARRMWRVQDCQEARVESHVCAIRTLVFGPVEAKWKTSRLSKKLVSFACVSISIRHTQLDTLAGSRAQEKPIV
jgi:hypothetical protein